MSELRLRQTDLHWREIDHEVIALEAQSSTYLAANPAGSLLWHGLVAGATRDSLAEALTDAYGIERERALADVDRFVSQVSAQGLLAT